MSAALSGLPGSGGSEAEYSIMILESVAADRLRVIPSTIPEVKRPRYLSSNHSRRK